MRALLSVVATLALLGAIAAPAAADATDVAQCIHVHAEARYRALGYDHVVQVADSCQAPATCAVSTDVNPQPQTVTVPGGAQVEVVTFIGSPARVFTPRVSCTMGARRTP